MDLRKGSQRPFHYFTKSVKYLFFASLILAVIFIFNFFEFSRYFPIRTVRVYGANHASQGEIQTVLRPLLHQGFFTTNVEAIRDNLSQLPWISSISVRRNWPDSVEINIIEKNALALWNSESLLSANGELFSPPQQTYPSNLPHFVGPTGQQVMMLQYFNDMNRMLTRLHAKISYLELSPYLNWKLLLDNGITLQIGHKDILTRLDHFVKVYPKIVGARAKDVEYIDLRYPNGIAVRWKPTRA